MPDPEVHSRRAGLVQGIEETLDEAPAPTAALPRGQQVDVQVGRVAGDDGVGGTRRPVDQRHDLGVGRARGWLPRGWRSRSVGHHSRSQRASKARVSRAPSV